MPLALQPYILTKSGKPRTEFVISLKTKDFNEAKRLALRKAVRVDAEIEAAERQLRNGIPPRRPDSPGPVEHPYEAVMRVHNEESQRYSDECENETDDEDEQLKEHFSRPYDELSPQDRIISRHLSPALFESDESVANRARAYEEAGNAFSERVALYGIEGALKPPYPRLMEIFDDYVSVARLAPASVKSWRRVIQHLIDHLGHDNAESITFANLRAWRDAVQNERLPNGNTRTAKTVRDTYIAAIKATLTYATGEELIRSNPATELKVRSKKSQPRLREKDFTNSEISTILNAASLALSNPAYSQITPQMKLARRWIPWLCAYTGARVNELTQLRACDIRQQGDVWVVHITPEAGSVKTDQAREVPLHPHLIEQGITKLASSSNSPIFYNPAKARNGSIANPHYKKVGEHLARWVRELGVVGSVQPNHAWRHTFKTRSRRFQLAPSAVNQILGHAAENVGEGYGRWEIEVLAREIAKLPTFETQI